MDCQLVTIDRCREKYLFLQMVVWRHLSQIFQVFGNMLIVSYLVTREKLESLVEIVTKQHDNINKKYFMLNIIKSYSHTAAHSSITHIHSLHAVPIIVCIHYKKQLPFFSSCLLLFSFINLIFDLYFFKKIIIVS